MRLLGRATTEGRLLLSIESFVRYLPDVLRRGQAYHKTKRTADASYQKCGLGSVPGGDAAVSAAARHSKGEHSAEHRPHASANSRAVPMVVPHLAPHTISDARVRGITRYDGWKWSRRPALKAHLLLRRSARHGCQGERRSEEDGLQMSHTVS